MILNYYVFNFAYDSTKTVPTDKGRTVYDKFGKHGLTDMAELNKNSKALIRVNQCFALMKPIL